MKAKGRGNPDQHEKKEPITFHFYNGGTNFDAEGYFEEKFGKAIKEKFPHITAVLIPATSGSLNKLIAPNQPIDVIKGCSRKGGKVSRSRIGKVIFVVPVRSVVDGDSYDRSEDPMPPACYYLLLKFRLIYQ